MAKRTSLRRTSLRAEQDQLRATMRDLGLSHAEIAAEFARRYQLRPRAAWRHAYGWTLQRAAEQANTHAARPGADPEGTAALTGPRLCEHEQWPAASGRRPTARVLALLARTYNTGVHDLLDLEDHQRLAPANRLLLSRLTGQGPGSPPVGVRTPTR